MFLINLILITFSFASVNQPKTNKELRNAAVMVVNNEMSSGGTGSILKSDNTGSLILTNKHVCRVVENGGYIIHERLRSKVVAYKVYTKHDLCIIKIKNNLGVNLKLADKRPEMADTSVVSGFPQLKPNTITRGHFSDLLLVNVMVGEDECTEEEFLTNMYCIFMGFKPRIETFKSQHTSNLIQPGNSGSAVFNGDGDLAGVVFAGSGDLGFALIVPYDFVVDFVKNQETYPFVKPTFNFTIMTASRSTDAIKNICNLIDIDLCKKTAFNMPYISR
jgi:S1-C subfamily serine protease